MRTLILLIASLVAVGARTAAAIDVTACGQNVPDGQVGDLVASLDCTGAVGHCVDLPTATCTTDQDCGAVGATTGGCQHYAVRLGSKATLRMHGFSIVGGVSGSPTGRLDVGVLCRGNNCVVEGGGGSIENFTYMGIWHFGRAGLTVSGLTFREAGTAILSSYTAKKLSVTDVTVLGGIGISSNASVVVTNVNLVHLPLPLCESLPYLGGRKVRGSNVTATAVVAERKLDMVGLTVDATPGCSHGVTVAKGIVRLTDSSITGAPGFDIVSGRRPRFVNTTCGSSRRIFRGAVLETESWGVCAGD